MMRAIQILRNQKGQGMVEYALIIVLVGIALIATLQTDLVGAIQGAVQQVVTALAAS